MNVVAVDKTSQTENSTTITNDKGRLSKYEIEYMIAEAEKYKNEDNTQRERISVKNSLELYRFNTRDTLDDDYLFISINQDMVI